MPDQPTPTFPASMVAPMRAALGLEVRQLANVLGVSERTVYAWASGDQPVEGPAAVLLGLIVENPVVAAWVTVKGQRS